MDEVVTQMGIYIPGMEMPTSCASCDVCCRYYLDRGLDGLLAKICRAESRLPDCPLVPGQEHGRLIEKGALLDKCYQHYEDFMLGKVDGKTALLNIEKEIKAAPTIIPAEEEGE